MFVSYQSRNKKAKIFISHLFFNKRKKYERVWIYSSLFWVPFRPPGLDFNLFFVLLKGNGFVEVQETRMKLNYWIIMLKPLQKCHFFLPCRIITSIYLSIFAWKSTNQLSCQAISSQGDKCIWRVIGNHCNVSLSRKYKKLKSHAPQG